MEGNTFIRGGYKMNSGVGGRGGFGVDNQRVVLAAVESTVYADPARGHSRASLVEVDG